MRYTKTNSDDQNNSKHVPSFNFQSRSGNNPLFHSFLAQGLNSCSTASPFHYSKKVGKNDGANERAESSESSGGDKLLESHGSREPLKSCESCKFQENYQTFASTANCEHDWNSFPNYDAFFNNRSIQDPRLLLKPGNGETNYSFLQDHCNFGLNVGSDKMDLSLNLDLDLDSHMNVDLDPKVRTTQLESQLAYQMDSVLSSFLTSNAATEPTTVFNCHYMGANTDVQLIRETTHVPSMNIIRNTVMTDIFHTTESDSLLPTPVDSNFAPSFHTFDAQVSEQEQEQSSLFGDSPLSVPSCGLLTSPVTDYTCLGETSSVTSSSCSWSTNFATPWPTTPASSNGRNKSSVGSIKASDHPVSLEKAKTTLEEIQKQKFEMKKEKGFVDLDSTKNVRRNTVGAFFSGGHGRLEMGERYLTRKESCFVSHSPTKNLRRNTVGSTSAGASGTGFGLGLVSVSPIKKFARGIIKSPRKSISRKQSITPVLSVIDEVALSPFSSFPESTSIIQGVDFKPWPSTRTSSCNSSSFGCQKNKVDKSDDDSNNDGLNTCLNLSQIRFGKQEDTSDIKEMLGNDHVGSHIDNSNKLEKVEDFAEGLVSKTIYDSRAYPSYYPDSSRDATIDTSFGSSSNSGSGNCAGINGTNIIDWPMLQSPSLNMNGTTTVTQPAHLKYLAMDTDEVSALQELSGSDKDIAHILVGFSQHSLECNNEKSNTPANVPQITNLKVRDTVDAGNILANEKSKNNSFKNRSFRDNGSSGSAPLFLDHSLKLQQMYKSMETFGNGLAQFGDNQAVEYASQTVDKDFGNSNNKLDHDSSFTDLDDSRSCRENNKNEMINPSCGGVIDTDNMPALMKTATNSSNMNKLDSNNSGNSNSTMNIPKILKPFANRRRLSETFAGSKVVMAASKAIMMVKQELRMNDDQPSE